jgi:hypothetical protein
VVAAVELAQRSAAAAKIKTPIGDSVDKVRKPIRSAEDGLCKTMDEIVGVKRVTTS